MNKLHKLVNSVKQEHLKPRFGKTDNAKKQVKYPRPLDTRNLVKRANL